ncbi:MAG TPA: HIT family protein [Ktedonobacterales bacterium]|nr:HIT family protein [Ktedonobacterales bacterium]
MHDEHPACAFCDRAALSGVLLETERFLLLADHAPLVEGHLLIIPRDHISCYGAAPAELDDELCALKRRIAGFLASAYRAPFFFEHGVFGQTVFHAHLHALPLGAAALPLEDLLAAGGRPVSRPADVRAWHVERGHYYYIERPGPDGLPAQAAVFPPDPQTYFRALSMLRDAAGRLDGYEPVPVRRAGAAPKIAALAAYWRALAATEDAS